MTAPMNAPSVLTVLNDPARAAMYGHLAQLAGVQVIQAEGALHALTQLERTPVDAIICDATLPDMTGEEFCSVLEGDGQPDRLTVYLIPNVPGDGEAGRAAGPEVLIRAFEGLGLEPGRYPVPLNGSAPTQLSGELGAFGLAEFLNWVAELGYTGHWLVTAGAPQRPGPCGHLTMQAGRLNYAEFGGRSGKAALLELLTCLEQRGGGEFRFYQCAQLPATSHPDFTQSTSRLLIELAVSLDEAAPRAR
jgi:CheY-like chemotaxis protein